MIGKYSGMRIPRPKAGGGAGRYMSSSARSSVFVSARCNPAVTRVQEFPTNGFHAGQIRNPPCGRESIRAVPIAPSTHSGVCLKTQTIPTNRVNCFTVCAGSSLRGVSKDTGRFPRSPKFAACFQAAFFRGDA